MKSWKVALILAVISLLLAFALAAAQEPVRSFEQLDTRLKPGDTVWVTDAQGREIRGKVTSLAAEALTLDAGGARTFAAADVRLVKERRPDSLANGALIGLVAGGGLALVGCLASVEGGDRGWCAGAAAFYGGVGAGIGVGIDALIPGKKLVVYRLPSAGSSSVARLSITPVVRPRAKGVALSFAF